MFHFHSSPVIRTKMLQFCTSCNNLYTYTHTPDRKLIMKCHSCGRPDDNILDNCVYFNKFVQSSYDIKIDPDQCHDPTLPNTDQISCLNESTCPSHNAGYLVMVQEKKTELENEMTAEAAEKKFLEEGGDTGNWLLQAWRESDQGKYNQLAIEQGLTTKVLPRIVFFHYNKEKKLAYICCLCQESWKN